MPPQDTIYIPGVTGPPSAVTDKTDTVSITGPQWSPQLEQNIDQDSLINVYTTQIALEKEEPRFLFPEWGMFLFILSVAVISAYLYIIKPSGRQRIPRPVNKKDKAGETFSEIHYDQWLNKYNPYYAALPAEMKKRFLARTIDFKESKEWIFHAMLEEEYIPVLISGAAVQLTFGLRNYIMDYFPVIHIMRKEYILNIDNETYYGHVSKNGIHISWNRFMEGYADYEDNVNVGLHEMAHAVAYDVYLGHEDAHDSKLKRRFYEFAEEGRPVFRAMRQGASHLLRDYGATNFDEFWAVCIESFFENPGKFNQQLPLLYKEISELLNQDPVLPWKIIDPDMAGLAI